MTSITLYSSILLAVLLSAVNCVTVYVKVDGEFVAVPGDYVISQAETHMGREKVG